MKSFLKKYLIAGIVVIVPIVATIWVLKTLILWMDGLIFSIIPHQLVPDYLKNIPGLGLLVTFALVLLIGIFTRLYIGKKIVQAGDSIFARLPFGRAIYKAIKQALHSTLSEDANKPRRVVLIEYPRPGTYAMAFQTGRWKKKKPEDKNQVMVFLPTAPNPTSGYLLIVDEDAVIKTDISTEEASRILISGGLLSENE